MRERSEGTGEADVGSKGESRRIDLSVPQVAGSALAAVVAAKLASSFGVYGTIAGAGLISVVATCGGSVLQHFFKRTGEQIRVKRTVAGVPTASVPATLTGASASASGSVPAAASGAASASGEFTAGTVYRARTRGWRRPLVAAALVFGVTMAGITVYEVASGQNLSGGHSTTVGSAFTGHNKSAADSGEPGDSDDSGSTRDGRDPGGSGDPGDAKDSGSGNDTPSATPSGTPDGTGDGTSPDGGSTEDGGTASSQAPAPDATGDDGAGDTGTPGPDTSATAPEPGASSRSGTDAPGQDGPAAP
ncbi:ATP-binding protein OS=Streptomyces tendae OX=1932 GN=GUR47_35005 PE=4 SV=1 [Streptomyces tendae]